MRARFLIHLQSSWGDQQQSNKVMTSSEQGGRGLTEAVEGSGYKLGLWGKKVRGLYQLLVLKHFALCLAHRKLHMQT